MANATISSVPGVAALIRYREWVDSQSRIVHVGLLVAIYVALAGASLTQGMIYSTVGEIPTLIIGWGIFLAGIYTAYAIGR
ncbi:hypothetical protein [Halocatena halophila]|uniref:hypothetical protein n=1 Tax=Halocatena halophila TaxID=2814576 RepID=UPI002ED09DED